MNNISTVISGFKDQYDDVKVINFTGKYGKAELKLSSDAVYLTRIKDFIEVISIVQDLGTYSKNILRYIMRDISNPQSKRALSSSLTEIHRRCGLLAYEVYSLFVGDIEVWKTRPIFIEGENSADSFKTAISHAVKKLYHILDGTKDLVSTLAYKLMKLLLDLNDVISPNIRNYKAVGVNPDHAKWLERVTPKGALNFIAIKKGREAVDSRLIDLVKVTEPVFDTVPEFTTLDDAYASFVSQGLWFVLNKKQNGYDLVTATSK